MSKVSQFYKYTVGGKEFQIRYKTPTVGEQIRIGQQYAALKAGYQNLDEVSDSLAFAVATLGVVISDKPKDLVLEELGVEDWRTLREMVGDYQQFTFFRGEVKEGEVPTKP